MGSADLAALRRAELPREFYARPVLTVARESLGKILVHATPDGVTAGRIVEAEAYRGPEDRAAHSYRGRRTPRTEVMFGPAGYGYVFFVYGMHYHFNLVTGREGAPEAVLIRAVEPVLGRELMSVRRGRPADRPELTNGPGKLCQAFAIDRACYGADLCGPTLFLADAPRARARRSPRIGVDYAGEWAERPWRFYEPDNRWVSKAR
ncbi:MAG: DNA-3-methyladenine glycosylase [Sorangiineae bacterium]|nr:DNA-3-methyladenine glycosylase [Polyangiaceae bacterium]MEB2321624.1 DNA-3-methyladenine glycosylase [Sorangiineae bacterium]